MLYFCTKGLSKNEARRKPFSTHQNLTGCDSF